MSIDFGTGNTTRYYSVPDSADFTLPDDDWSVMAPIWFPSGQSTANAYYILSTNNYNIANSFNFFVRSSTQELSATFNLYGELICAGVVPTNKWHLCYAARRSGNLYVGRVALDGSSSAESSATAITGASNGVSFTIGGRNDLLSTRFWQGKIGYVASVSGHGISATSAAEIAKGTPLLGMSFASQIVDIFHGRTSSGASFKGLIKGHVATKNGTSYGTVEDDIITPYIWTPDHVTRTFSANNNIDGAAVTVSTATGALSTSIDMSGSAATVSVAGGDLTTSITLSGNAVAQALSNAGLDTSIILSGDATGQASASGDLSSGSNLSGAASAVATSDAALTAQIQLSAAAVAQALASGSLDQPINLAGNAVATSSASGILLTQIPLSGAATAQVTSSGGLTSQIQLAGAALNYVSATGSLTVNIELAGNAVAQVLAGGSLTTQIQFSASAVAQALASGALAGSVSTIKKSERYTAHAVARNYGVDSVGRDYRVAA